MPAICSLGDNSGGIVRLFNVGGWPMYPSSKNLYCPLLELHRPFLLTRRWRIYCAGLGRALVYPASAGRYGDTP